MQKAEFQNSAIRTPFHSGKVRIFNHLPKSVIAHWKLNCAIRERASPESRILSFEFRIRNQFDLGSPVLTPDPWFLLRKEVIQPQVPLRLPCYDFIPITSHTFGHCLLAVNGVDFGYNRLS